MNAACDKRAREGGHSQGGQKQGPRRRAPAGAELHKQSSRKRSRDTRHGVNERVRSRRRIAADSRGGEGASGVESGSNGHVFERRRDSLPRRAGLERRAPLLSEASLFFLQASRLSRMSPAAVGLALCEVGCESEKEGASWLAAARGRSRSGRGAGSAGK